MRDDELLELPLQGWPLPDLYLVELGRVSALWAGLDSFLNLCVGKLCGFNEIDDMKPFILITHSSFPQRLDMLSALCEQLRDEFPNLKDYQSVVRQMREAQSLRNDFAHYGMAVNPGSGDVEMAKGTARGTVKLNVKRISIADLRRASVAIHDAQRALYRLVLGRQLDPAWVST